MALTNDIVSRLDLTAFGDRLSRLTDGSVIIDTRDAERSVISLAAKLLERIERLEQQVRAEAKEKFRSCALLETFESVLQQRPTGALEPNYEDLWFLFDAIRQRAPQQAVEFGSGFSTYAIALALRENNAGHLISLDGDEAWTAVTRASLPSELSAWCEIICAPVAEIEWQGTPAFQHSITPDVQADFLYLDSPPLTPERRVAVDPLLMEARFTEDVLIVVDGRRENVTFLQQYLAHEYTVEADALYFMAPDGERRVAANYMTTFERVR